MVKGVNKTVIVVNDTGNELFEKIVFYVTPKYGKTNLKQLKKAAGDMSASFLGSKSAKNSVRKRFLRRRALFLLSCLAIIAAVTVLIVMILH